MSYFDCIMSATQSQQVAKRHISKTAKALARAAFDCVDLSEVIDFDESEISDMQEQRVRYANAHHEFD